MATYEVAIYNAEVRDCLQKGEKHDNLSDDWADTHYLEFRATDESGARSAAERRYPADLGYVINTIEKVN